MATDHNFKVKNGLDIDGANATIVQDGNETRITSTGEIRFRPEGSSSNKVRITLNTTHISGKLQATGINHSNGVEILDMDHATYTMLKSPEGDIGLHIGDSGDTGNYYSNTTHHVRSRDGTTYFTTTTSSGLNVRTGTIKIDGTTVIDSSRNLTNIGTISSGAITSTGSITSGNITSSGQINISKANPVLILNDTTASSNANQVAYISFQDNGTEEAWIGWGSSGNTNFTINNSIGNIVLNGSTTVNAALTATQLNINSGTTNTCATFDSSDDKAFIIIRDDDTDAYLITKDGNFSIGNTSSDYNNFKVNLSNGNTVIDGTLTSSGKLTINTATDEAFTLNSTDDGPVYMSFERGASRHAYVGFGGSNDTFYIRNEESGGAMVFYSGNSLALTLSSSQDANFEGNVTTIGYLQHYDYLYSRQSLRVLNAAGNGWHDWATRGGGKFDLNVNNIVSSGTISSSSNITAGNSSNNGYVQANLASGGGTMTLYGYGLEMNRSASYIRPTSDNDKTLYFGDAGTSLDWNAIHFRSGNGLYMTGTQFLTTDRNLVNIGTINTGQGATEVYLMNQNVRSSDSPTFQDLTIQGNLSITGDINSYNVTDLDVVDKTITLGVGGTASANDGGGIIVDGANAKLTWNNSNSYWQMNKQLAFNDTATTTNQGLGIRWSGFDKEGTTDFTDRASILHTVNTGGHTGSVLLFTAENDANDGIAFVTNASSKLKHNSNNIFTDAYHPNADTLTTARTIAGTSFDGSANIDISYDNLTNKPSNISNSDTVDGLHASSFLRSDADDSISAGVTYTWGVSDDTALIVGRATGAAEKIHIGGWTTANSSNIHRIRGSSNLHIDSADGGDIYLNFYNSNNAVRIGGSNLAWHAGNDGSGSGLDADTVDGKHKDFLMHYKGIVSGNWDTIFSQTDGHMGVYEVQNISNTDTNYPSGSYTYGGVLSWQLDNSTFKLYAPHTGTLWYQNGWNNDEYSGWRKIWDNGNDGSGSGLDADTLDGLHSTGFIRNAGTWMGAGFSGSRAFGMSVNGGEIAFLRDHPNNGQMSILVDGGYHAGENNGFYSIYSGNNYSNKVGFNSNSSGHFLINTTNVKANSNTVWHAGNDGSGSGLDADLLDGQHGSHYLNYNNLSNKPTIPGAFNGGTITSDITISNTSPALNLVDTNSFSDANDRFVYRAADNRVRWEWYDNSAGTTTTVLDLDSTGLLKTDDLRLNTNHHLQRSDHHSGHLEGSYNNIGDNATKSNPIYTIGSAYNPNDAGLANMYGIGFSHTNASFISFTGASNWGLYVASDGDARVWLGASNGVISSTGQHYVGSNVVWNAGNDGSGSGLDADTLDGVNSGSFLRSDTTDTSDSKLSFRYEVSNLNSVSGDKGVTPFRSTFQASNRPGTGNYFTGAEYTFHDNGARAQLGFGSSGNNTIPHLYARTEGWSGSDGWHSWYLFWHSGNDGSGSGLDADTVDGIQGGSFLRSDATDTASGAITFTGNMTAKNTKFLGGNSYNENVRCHPSSNDYSSLVLGAVSGDSGTGTGQWTLVRYPAATHSNKFSIRHNSSDLMTILTNGNIYHGSSSLMWHAGNDGSGSGLDADTLDGVESGSFLRSNEGDTASGSINFTNDDYYFGSRLRHHGDGDTYMQFHAADQWRVVTGGTERFEVNNTFATFNADVNIGGTGNKAVRVRHIEGKDHDSADLGALYLNYNTTNPVSIGHSGNQSDLYLYGTLRIGSTAVIDYSRNMSNIGTISSGAITSSGDVTAFSDERLKSNIQTLDGKKALQMRGVSFEKDGIQSSGVIAQEIEKIAPELVHTSDDEIKTKSVAYGNLVGYLIEAVKEQQEQINKLTDRINDLEKGE